MAKQLYDYWFVQFDFPDENGRPYMSSGGKMVWNEILKKNIPAEWTVKKIADIADINALTISKDNGLLEILYLDTSNLSENRISEIQMFRLNEAPSRAQRMVKDRTILYSTVRPRLKHYGILCNPQSNLIVSTGFCTIDAKLKENAFWIYLFLTQNWVIDRLGSIADTAVSSYPSINSSDIENLYVCYPPKSVLGKFDDCVSSMFISIENNESENTKLKIQRDELLPLLMNGQVSVTRTAVNCDLSRYHVEIRRDAFLAQSSETPCATRRQEMLTIPEICTYDSFTLYVCFSQFVRMFFPVRRHDFFGLYVQISFGFLVVKKDNIVILYLLSYCKRIC
jgi:type I restriction enzyme S subunit